MDIKEIEKNVVQTAVAMSILAGQPEAERVGKETSLREELGFDSLKMVELVIALEEAFAIQIDEADLDPQALNTVGDLCKLAARYAAD